MRDSWGIRIKRVSNNRLTINDWRKGGWRFAKCAVSGFQLCLRLQNAREWQLLQAVQFVRRNFQRA